MFAFGPTEAIWRDGGVGDPNGLSDVMRYHEQASPDFEVLPGTGLIDASVLNGAVNVPMLALEFTSHGLADLQLQPLRLKAYGTGNDKNEVVRASLWWDRNANGAVDAGDTAISSAPFSVDNGEVILPLGGVPELHQLYPRQLLVTYDFSNSARSVVTFYVTLRPDQTQALVADGAPRWSPQRPRTARWPGGSYHCHEARCRSRAVIPHRWRRRARSTHTTCRCSWIRTATR